MHKENTRAADAERAKAGRTVRNSCFASNMKRKQRRLSAPGYQPAEWVKMYQVMLFVCFLVYKFH